VTRRRKEVRAAYAFTCHPDALSDLRWLPAEILTRALRDLQRAVRGEAGMLHPLDGVLAGLHKIYLDPAAEWRLVVQIRPAPADSPQDQELFLVAAGPRQIYTVYRDAQLRLRRDNPRDRPTEMQAALARARSPRALRLQRTADAPPAAGHSPAPAPRTARTRRPPN
jgi:hypothetical protein